jgi:hypothetical protein
MGQLRQLNWGEGVTNLQRRMGCTTVVMLDADGRKFRVAVRGEYGTLTEVADAICDGHDGKRYVPGKQFKVKYLPN